MSNKETIAAIATPAGRGGIGVIRISGPQAPTIALQILGHLPTPREAAYLPFRDHNGEVIDEGIALYFPAPRSFTGEDVVELQGHGGPVVMDCLLRRVIALGARPARPGEFSETAFLNGKIDLTQAEAIADLIDAASEQAAHSALKSLQGEFSRRIQVLVAELVQLRTYVEAAIDFPTEEIDFISESTVVQDLSILIQSVEDLRLCTQQGAVLRDGLTVVIIGKPNAGKSSLLNSLSGRDSAIVTEIPGTTRDVLRELIHLDGMPLHIIDTAGLRETDDIVEREGIRRTHATIQQADVIVWISEESIEPDNLPHLELSKKIPKIWVKNKIDLTGEMPKKKIFEQFTLITLSAKFQQGIALLRDHLKSLAGFSGHSEGLFTARRRHLTAIDKAQSHLQQGFEQINIHGSAELLAEDLRQAQQALNEITGEFSADDLLGKIFSTFCIGK